MSAVRLHHVLGRVGAKAIYIYDSGDGWEHETFLAKRLPVDPNWTCPACTAGQRACPLEDCGGIPRFYELLEAIQNPERERHEELPEWVGEDHHAVGSLARPQTALAQAEVRHRQLLGCRPA